MKGDSTFFCIPLIRQGSKFDKPGRRKETQRLFAAILYPIQNCFAMKIHFLSFGKDFFFQLTKVMKMKTVLLFGLFAILIQSSVAQHILIYTHNGEGYVHENIASSVEALKKLCKEHGYTSEDSDDPSLLTSENLTRFECIIFSNTNNEAFVNESQREAFRDYIRNGGGFVGIHSASGSERNSEWFAAMLGGRFVSHPKYQEFTIRVIDHDHPATNFLEEEWKWEDECYYTNNLNPDIHVLLAADLRTVDDPKKDTYPGRIFGDYFPLSWCHEFDGGRQFYTALGHNKDHYSNETFLNHLAGGIRWVIEKP